MHITVNREQLLRSLEIVSRVSTKHQTLPVLQCVLIEARDTKQTCTLRATNLELGIEVQLAGTTTTGGTIAVPAQLLQQTIQLLSEKEVTITQDGEAVVVQGGKSHTTIKTFSPDEFPSIPTLSGEGSAINGALFALGIKTAAFAASQSSIKPELGSVLIQQQKEHTLTFVATDSFRLIEKTVPQKGLILEQSLLVPYRNALELARICELVGEDPLLVVSENQLALRFSRDEEHGVYVTTRLTEASFPDYQQIIPKEFGTTVTVLRGDLIQALKKTSIFINPYLQVRVAIDPTANTIRFSADNGEVGRTEETLVATVMGGALELSFNQRYLSDPLTSFTDDSIVLSFAGVGRPMVMSGTHEGSLRYLVMPMNR